MALKQFCNFDRRKASPNQDIFISGFSGAAFANIQFREMMFPDGFAPVDTTSDTIATSSYLVRITNSGSSWRQSQLQYYGDRSLGMWYANTSGFNLHTSVNFAGVAPAIAISKNQLGSVDPNEVWVTMDWSPNYNIPSSFDSVSIVRSEKRFQIFAFGDLSVRLLALRNYTTIPTARCDVVVGLYNGTTKLSEITVPGVQTGFGLNWIYLKIHARLDGANGALEVTADGYASSHTGINTVATTAASSPDAEYMFFSGGSMGVTSGLGAVVVGVIDSLYIDDVGFPPGRPVNRVATLSGDATVSGWATSTGGTITTALGSDGFSPVCRGNGVGSKAELNFTLSDTTGFFANVLGIQVHAAGFRNTDLDDAKRVAVGLVHSGVYNMGTNAANQILPTHPSYIDPGLEQFVYRTGTTLYTVAGINNNTTKLVLEVTNP